MDLMHKTNGVKYPASGVLQVARQAQTDSRYIRRQGSRKSVAQLKPSESTAKMQRNCTDKEPHTPIGRPPSLAPGCNSGLTHSHCGFGEFSHRKDGVTINPRISNSLGPRWAEGGQLEGGTSMRISLLKILCFQNCRDNADAGRSPIQKMPHAQTRTQFVSLSRPGDWVQYPSPKRAGAALADGS